MVRKLVLPLVLLLYTIPLSSTARAQEVELPEINLYGGLSAPVGDFSDDTGTDAGYASFGLGVMGEYVLPVGSPGLGWVSSASLLINGADDDFIGQGADVGRYFIIPLMTGLRYFAELSPTVDGYGLGQVGVSIVRGPSGDVGDTEYSSNFATSFGFGLGGGIVLNDRINLTLRYLILGEQEFEYDIEGPGGDTEGEAEVSVGVVQVMIGFQIGN